MSSSMFTLPTAAAGIPIGLDQDINSHLEDLAGKLKDSHRPETPSIHWELINRVLAYAASAEQHISEQQARICELEALSSTDELTGLHNRRGLYDFMTRALSLARRHEEKGVLAFLDLDNFKQINDTYGHNTGDLALKTFAETIKSNLRESDFVARVGGDEFVFVLIHTSEEDGRKRALTIQKIADSTTLTLRDRELPLKASMGIIAYNGDSNYGQLMRSADLAMYKNKRAKKR